jgi:prepilin-type N-terminal cleavage/methylation domain-containing protein
MPRPIASPSHAPRGFSIIEVLVAVLVSAIGFSAVFALQIRTLQGNISAREQSAGMVLAESALETLRTETYRWRVEAPPSGLLSVSQNEWHSLTPAGPVDQAGLPFEVGGTPGSQLSRQRFCVHYWLEAMAGTFSNMLNVRIRVLWPRAPQETRDLALVCSDDGATAFRENLPDNIARWNSLVLPGALRMRD